MFASPMLILDPLINGTLILELVSEQHPRA